MNDTSTSATEAETADVKPQWIDDGHQVTVTLDYGQFAFAVICPSDGVDLSGKPWIELPVCRRVLDEDGQPQLDESPASECYLAQLGKEFTADEFFDSDVPVFEVVSPFAVEYRFEGWDSEAVYVRPKLVAGQGVLPVETPRGFRVGDLVQITGRDDEFDSPRGMQLNGRTGHITELDPGADYPIGLTVEGWIGPVWCNSGEIRHADTADCPSCRGTGSHREPDPGDAEFESDRECLDCDGTGRVAAGAASAAETAGSAK